MTVTTPSCTCNASSGLTATVHYVDARLAIYLDYDSKNKKLWDDIVVEDSATLVYRGREVSDSISVSDVVSVTTNFNVSIEDTIQISDRTWDISGDERTLNGSTLSSGLIGMTRNRNSPAHTNIDITTTYSDTLTATETNLTIT